MAVRLAVTENSDPGTKYTRSFVQDRIVIGRARSSDVCLPDLAVSTRHAEIQLSGTDYVLKDLESVNGTLVNGKELVAYRGRPLVDGDEIRIAGFTIRFQSGVAPGPEEARDVSVQQAREMMANVLARSGEGGGPLSLLAVSGPNRGDRFDLRHPPATLVVGRGRQADISLEDREIAQVHAEISVKKERIQVRDMSGRRGIFVGGERIESAVIEPGGRITLGKTTLLLEHPADRSLGVIFEAPEEETSSFAMVTRPTGSKSPLPPDVETEAGIPPEVTAPAPSAPRDSSPEPSRPPVGPADPLVQRDSEVGRASSGPIASEYRDDRSDAGLIAIGAIILIASVAALIYLFS